MLNHDCSRSYPCVVHTKENITGFTEKIIIDVIGKGYTVDFSGAFISARFQCDMGEQGGDNADYHMNFELGITGGQVEKTEKSGSGVQVLFCGNNEHSEVMAFFRLITDAEKAYNAASR